MSNNFKRDKTYFQAIAVMIGYTIGVGMFGLPYIVSKAGVGIFLAYILFFGSIQYLIHLIYANIIVATSSFHRLPGYVEIYLGKKGKNLAFLAKMVGNVGALLAYIIISGIFLHQLLSPYLGGSEFMYASILFFLEAGVVYFGIKAIAKAELLMTAFLILVVLFLAWKGHGVIEKENYILLNWKYLLLPYGAILFSLDGGGSLPIVARMLKKNKDAVKSVVRISTFTSISILTLFVLVIVGLSGANTTTDALVGIANVFNDGFMMELALIFGLLTMATSFFGVSESVKETLWWDYKLNKKLAWALSVFVPYTLYVFGFKNLIKVISFAGGVAGGFSATMLMTVFLVLKRKSKKGLFKTDKLPLFKIKPHDSAVYFLIMLFILGMFYEIWSFLK